MPIDKTQIKWDAPAALDVSKIQWDEPQPKGTGSATLDAGNAVGTGYMGGLSHLAGMGVDAIANIRDLGKAALGAPYIAATGKVPPQWLQINDRSQDVGSGANIIKNAKKTKLGNVLLTAANPEYEGGYLQAAGSGLGGIMSPESKAQVINQAVNGVSGNVLSKLVYDTTGNVELAIAAGMSPTAAQNLAIGGTKRVVRGGEDGRKAMEQRIQELKNAGIDAPTLGLASGNKIIGGTENLLQNTPGAVGIMQRNRDAALAGIESKTMGAADLASANRGAMESGRSIQSGARDFKENAKVAQSGLYDNLDRFIPGQTPASVDATKTALGEINPTIPGAPNLSKFFQNSKIKAIEEALNADTTGGGPYTPSQIKAALEKNPQRLQELNAALDEGKLPFEALKKTRTLVGNEIADNSLLSDVPRSKWKPLYGALSDDMQGAANAAGPDAAQTLNRANNYTRSSIGRLERIAPIVDRTAPEQSFTALKNTLGENTSTFQAVKKSLPEGARGDFAGTVIERLGKARPGQQNDLGDNWSPETFLTNWNSMKPQARDELLSGFKNAAQVKADIEAVAKATSMMRDNSKMWANPSGTGANTVARGMLGAISAGGAAAAAGMVNPMVPLGAAGVMGSSNLLARALTSPKVVNSMSKNSYIDPNMQNALINALISGDALSERKGK